MADKIIEAFVDSGKLGPMLVILVLSLFAVSFPTISKQVPVIRIPHVVFFMGKHFGTGVILSTAFCHLLQDSFQSLQAFHALKPHSKIAKWTGLIILCSFLSIFLIEYISTTCVDYLHASPDITYSDLETRKTLSESNRDQRPPATPSEHQSLLGPDCPPHQDLGQHRHHGHHTKAVSLPVELITNSRHRIRCCLSERCTCESQEEQTLCYDERLARQRRKQDDTPKIKSVKKQLIGIMVLQLGIMIHSLVIGLTLSIKHGPEFASLLIAICFHQLFEGLSLGIRIDALPPLPRALLYASASSSQLSIASESTPLLPDPQSREWSPSFNSGWMKTILSILFAITTPLGMVLGLAIFPRSIDVGDKDEKALFLLTQGVMSAISAGMLIYAGTVEMLAADFVFGDVSGGHLHHSSGHAHQVSDLEESARGHVGHEVSEDGDGHGPAAGELHHPEGHKTSTIRQKMVAVIGLLAGVAVMNITAIFE
ncbi:ZIP Zinc transporter domain containing protein [Amanita muscaria]